MTIMTHGQSPSLRRAVATRAAQHDDGNTRHDHKGASSIGGGGRGTPLALAGAFALSVLLGAASPAPLHDSGSGDITPSSQVDVTSITTSSTAGAAVSGYQQRQWPASLLLSKILGPLQVQAAYAEAPPVATAAAGGAAGTEPLSKRSERDSLSLQMGQRPEDMGLGPEEINTIRIFERTTPAVVNITNLRAARVSPYSLDTQLVPAGTGSGFVWDDKGHIVTNYHVIKGAAEVKVTLLDQSTYTAKVLGGDSDKDVAVLQLQMPPERLKLLRPVVLGSSAQLLVGQRVLAIGNPFGLDHTLTQGIVSGIGRELNNGYYTIKNVIQTDAAINPGNSGGVLLDSGGRVIGINTAIADPTGKGAYSGVGFAIPIDAVKGLVGQILQYGRVVRPVLGVTLAPPQVLKQLGQKGVLVYEVPQGSPADKAGLKPTSRDPFTGAWILGDIITGIDGKPVKSYGDLLGVLDEKRPGDVVRVEVLRSQPDGGPGDGGLFGSMLGSGSGGEARRLTLSLTLGERGALSIAE